MRRWFHCLLIAVLTCSLSVDTAKACWYLRQCHAARGCWQPVCPPVPTWPGCHEVVVIRDFDCCGGMAEAPVVIVDGWRHPGCGVEGSELVVVNDSVVQPHESIVATTPALAEAPAPVPTQAGTIAEPQPAPEAGVAAVAPTVPELKPAVETVAALEPAPAESVAEPLAKPEPAEPAPEPEVQQTVSEPEALAPAAEPAVSEPIVESQPVNEVAAAEPPAPAAEPNIFEEVEAAADAAMRSPADSDSSLPTADAAVPATKPQAENLFGDSTSAPAPAADPLATEPAAEPAEPGSEAEPEPASGAEPGPAPAAEPPAADEAGPFGDASREPARRWVDDTGRFTSVGVLVDVRADGVEIRKANGRTVIVPLERLSEHDRGYVAAAGARLAAERAPAARETAGL